jgi:hypothetical protein
MRVFVSSRPSHGGGKSSLVDYIARSKVDRDREHLGERASRPLFSAYEDDLTRDRAEALLNPTAGELLREDVVQLIVSPEPGTFERAGRTHEERLGAFREGLRDAVREIEAELKVQRLFWIGGLHANTNTPHGHLAYSRWALGLDGKLVYIDHLPESLLPRNREGADGEKRFSPGKIAEVFARSLDRRLMPVRFIELRDAERGVEAARSLVTLARAEMREPTREEREVGRWLAAELALSAGAGAKGVGREELIRECEELRASVAAIDSEARSRGARPPAAYVEPGRLEELLRARAGSGAVKAHTELPRGAAERVVVVPPAREAGGDAVKEAGRMDKRAPAQRPVEPGGAPSRSVSDRQVGTRGKSRDAGSEERAAAKSTRAGADRPRAGGATTKAKAEVPRRVGTMTLAGLRQMTAPPHAASDAPEKRADGAQSQVKEHADGPAPENAVAAQPQAPAQEWPRDAPAAGQTIGDVAAPAPDVTHESRGVAPSLAVPEVARVEAAERRLPPREVTDEELAALAGHAAFHRQFLQREYDLKAGEAHKMFAERRARGERIDPQEKAAVRDSFAGHDVRLREAILLDDIYDDARRRRGLERTILTPGQEELLRGRRETLAARFALEALPGQGQAIRESLAAVTTPSNERLVEDYWEFMERHGAKDPRAAEGRGRQPGEAAPILEKDRPVRGAEAPADHEKKVLAPDRAEGGQTGQTAVLEAAAALIL